MTCSACWGGRKNKYPWGRSVHKKKSNRFNREKGDRITIGGDLLTTPNDLDGMEPPYIVFLFRPKKASGIAASSIMWVVEGLHGLWGETF